jgi:HlyD family secretion protein
LILRRRSVPVIAGMAAGLAVLVYLLLPQPAEVDLAPVVRGPMQVTVDEDGKTRIRERYVISAPLSGRISRIELHPGDLVLSEKTLLAVIDPVDPALLNDRDRAEAEARVKGAEAARQRAAAALQEAKAVVELARHELERANKLMETRSISRQDFDSAEHKEAAATEQFRVATFGVRISEYELELSQAALLRSRPGFRGDTDAWRLHLHSPVDGCVLRVFQEDATVVSPGMRLLEVGDPADLEVEVDVLSTDAVKITPGADVLIENWGEATPLKGRVRLVEPAGFTRISALGVEEQRVLVFVTFVDPYESRRRLGDAFRIDARIVVWEAEDVLKVPAGALFRDGDVWAAFRARSGRANLTRIRVGQSNGIETEVLDGLQPGDEVILHPTDTVEDGIRIRRR